MIAPLEAATLPYRSRRFSSLPGAFASCVSDFKDSHISHGCQICLGGLLFRQRFFDLMVVLSFVHGEKGMDRVNIGVYMWLGL